MFKNEIDSIKDEKLKKMMNMIVTDYGQIFETLSASKTCLYHPPEECGEGGLVLHSRRMSKLVDSGLTEHFNLSEHEKDLLIVSVLLHDIGKVVGEPHWEESSRIFNKYASECGISRVDRQKISNAILSHMGSWVNNPRQPETKFEIILSMLDFIDSRRFVHISMRENKWVEKLIGLFMSI